MNTDNFVWTDELVIEYLKEMVLGELGKEYNHMDKFKQSKQPPISKEDKRIGVELEFLTDGFNGRGVYWIETTKQIHPDKFLEIKQAIERVLNEDTVVEGSKTWEFCSECKNKRLCSFSGRCEKSSAEVDELKNNILYLEQTLEANQDKVYSKSEVDAMKAQVIDFLNKSLC